MASRSSLERSAPTLLFDCARVRAYLRSVARARAAAHHIRLRWEPYRDSSVLNALYKVMWWKGEPGTAEVESGDAIRIATETDRETKRLLEVFLVKCTAGPRVAVAYLEAEESSRADCVGLVEQTYRDAADINRQVIEETAIGVRRLAAIRCASTITFKTAGLFAGGLPAFFVDVGYDVTLDVIKEWSKGPQARVIGVGLQTGAIESGKEGVQQIAEIEEKDLTERAAAHARKAGWLEKRIDEMEKALKKTIFGDRGAKAQAKLAQTRRRYQAATKTVTSASRWAKALGAVQVVFFAYELYGAVRDYREDT